MRRWPRWLYWILLIGVMTTGCGSSNGNSTTGIIIAPQSATVLLNGFVQFFVSISSGSASDVIWAVNGVEGGDIETVGTITSAGLYQAPATIPVDTPITITVTVGNESASATVTLDSGVRVSVTPGAATVGAGENFPFTATVTGVPSDTAISGTCDSMTSTPVPCTAVTWSVTSGSGSIDSNAGIYTAPATTDTATVTATSVFDSTKSASASVTIVLATDPTITSVTPNTGAVGALHQDVYLTGTDFISTTSVFISGTQVSTSDIAAGSSTTLQVRVRDSFLTTAGTLTFTVARPGGMQQACPDLAQCQLELSPVRPAIVGTSPDSILQGSSAAVSFNVNGGYFGTRANPAITAEFAGQPISATISTTNPARQLRVTIGEADLSTPGLFPVSVRNQSSGSPPAVANVAVQPQYQEAPGSTIIQLPNSPLSVGINPTAVAINPATGLAVVANQGSNDITLIDLTTAAPTVVSASICTGSIGAVSAPCPVTSGPVSVAVDELRNIALVANSTAQNVAVVDLSTQSVTAIIPSGPTSIARIPWAVGINPMMGRGIVAYQTAGFASILDLTQEPPAVIGVVSISNGATPRVSISSKLNWALVTPGGSGSLSIVDLGQQSEVSVVTASRASGTVTVTTSGPHGLQVDEAVLITEMSDESFDGVFTVLSTPSTSTFTYSQPGSESSSGGTVKHALPVVTLATSPTLTGVAFNNETDQAILVNPAEGFPGTILNTLDQTSTAVSFPQTLGNIGAAFNPLANIAVTVNQTANQAFVIDPTTPAILETFTVGTDPVDVAIDPPTNIAVIVNHGDNSVSIFSLGNLRPLHVLEISPTQIVVESTLASPAAYSDQVITIIGKGFTGSSEARLDGDSTSVEIVSFSDRMMTIRILANRLESGGPRRYALDVADGGSVSNATSFTVMQSVDVTETGCLAPAPHGVAIDSQRNLAVITNLGCDSVSLIDLETGTGQTVSVGVSPVGVDVFPQAGLAVVANSGSNTASVVDLDGGTVVATVTTDLGPTGVAIDPLLGQAIVVATGANVVNVFPVSLDPGTPTRINVQQTPGGVAVDPARHLAAVANIGRNTVSLVDLTQAVATAHVGGFAFPAGLALDPVSGNFLVASSLSNQVLILNPVSQVVTPIRTGINPTSITYNFASSTLVTMNSVGSTMTVMDLLERRVRAVLPATPSSLSLFSVAIHPFTNLAVVADSTHNRVLLFPLPR